LPKINAGADIADVQTSAKFRLLQRAGTLDLGPQYAGSEVQKGRYRGGDLVVIRSLSISFWWGYSRMSS